MKFLKIIIVLLVVSSPLYAQARKKKSTSDTITTKIVLPEIKLNKDSMINNLNREINTMNERVIELKGSNSDKDQIIKSRDAEIIGLKKHLIEDSIKIQSLKNRLNFADTVIVRISNDCLGNKYDSVRVKEALVYFKNMYSQELQSKFSPLERLLKQYSNYTKEISDILAEAEKDPNLKNFFNNLGQKTASSYIRKIESTRYYREVYNANWTIPFLNNSIERIIIYLKAFDPKVNREIKLLDKMN